MDDNDYISNNNTYRRLGNHILLYVYIHSIIFISRYSYEEAVEAALKYTLEKFELSTEEFNPYVED